MQKNTDIFLKSDATDNYISISTPSDFQNFKNKVVEKDISLNNLFGGKKSTRKRNPSKKGSKKGSKKTTKKKSSKKKSKLARTSSKKGSKKGSKKASKKKTSRKGSKKKSSRNISRITGEPIKKKREMAPAAKEASAAFRELVKVVVADKDLDIKFGPVALKLASIYKQLVQKEDSSLTTMDAIKAAEKLFNSDSKDEKKKNLEKAIREIELKKAAKKAKKQSEMYSETSN